MSDLPGGVQLLVFAVIFGLIGLAIGNARKQHPTKSFLVSALLGPLGWLLILISKPDRSVSKQCPACLADVPLAATACRHCGRDLPVAAAS
jgi:hypothetical protein